MVRGLTTLVVAGALGAFAAGDARAQTETPTTAGSTQSSLSQGQQGPPEGAARERLLEARESLAELAKMPEAAQLQGQARTEVSQAITNFNALLTAEANWYDQYKMVMQNLHNVLGPTGSAEGAAPPALRDKLIEFRQKLMAFGREAGAPDVAGGVQGTSGTTGASSASSTSGAATSAQAESLEQHIGAIDDIIQEALAGTSGGSSGTVGTSGSAASSPGVVTIERQKLDRIQSHLQRMRELARSKGIK